MPTYVKKVVITLLIILAFILVPLLLYYIFPHFIPFIIAYICALLLEPANNWLMRQTKMRRPLAVNITFFASLGAILCVAYFIVTKITREVLDLIKFMQKNIPYIQYWFTGLQRAAQDFLLLLPPEVAGPINSAFTNFMNNLGNMNLLSSIGSQTFSLTAAIPNFFIILLLFLISLYLISLNLNKINAKFYSFFTDNSKEKLTLVLSDLRTATVGFLQAQLILSTITYILSLFGLIILGVRYALAIALVIVIVDILPILGVGSALVPWGIFSIFKGNTFLGMGLIILFILITVIRRIIEPKIVGERIGLSPLSTLISLWVGLKVLGLAGVFLGPLTVILYKALVKAKVIRLRIKI